MVRVRAHRRKGTTGVRQHIRRIDPADKHVNLKNMETYLNSIEDKIISLRLEIEQGKRTGFMADNYIYEKTEGIIRNAKIIQQQFEYWKQG